MFLLLVIAGSAICCAVLTPLILRFAKGHQILDNPASAPDRKKQPRPVPLLGGSAIYLTIFGLVVAFMFATSYLNQGFLHWREILALLLGGVVIMIGGYLDDRYHLPPRWSIVAPIIAALIVVVSGIGVNFVTSPLGGVIRIDILKLPWVNSVGIPLSLGAMGFTFLWLMGAMYTTKIMDGLDGLVSGVTAISALVLVGLSLRPPVLQPDTALLAAIIAGAFIGFLYYNWSPARMYLGEGGSLLAGFLLSVVAVISGGKIATTALMLGIPMLDVAWSIIRRVLSGRSMASADNKHLHFQLLNVGLSTRQVVMLAYVFTAVVGLAAIFLHSRGKLATLLILPVIFLLVILRLTQKTTAI